MDENCKESNSSKILIIAIHGPYEPWVSILHDGQRKTWMKSWNGIRIINIQGRRIHDRFLKLDQTIYFLRWSRKRFIAYLSLLAEACLKEALFLNRYRPRFNQGNYESSVLNLELQMPDTLMLQGVKNLAAFRKSLDYEYEFLVTTITSSYLNLHALRKCLDKVDPDGFLGGRIEKSGSMHYQQGSFRVYSRDVVENLVSHSRRYKHWKIEDIAMGNLAASLYSNFTELPNLTLQSVGEVEELTEEELKQTISFRCKSTQDGIRKDVEVMHSLHEKLLLGR